MLIIYTCITGNYDDLIPQPSYEGVKYICFSDSINKSQYHNWEIFPIPSLEINQPNLINRYLKALHYNLDFNSNISMYIDGNVLIKSNPTSMVRQFEESAASIAAFKHPHRENIMQEFEELISTQKLTQLEIKKTFKLLESMKAEGYDFTPLLSAGYIILRRHDDHVLKIALREWLDIILNECKRDQMSLQFVLWKHGITMKYLDDFIDPHLFFSRYDHGIYSKYLPRELQDLFKKIKSKIVSIFKK